MENWERSQNSADDVVFTNRKQNGAYQGGYESIRVSRGGMSYNTVPFPMDEWSVSGACVGFPSA